jgi:hypothetical protein
LLLRIQHIGELSHLHVESNVEYTGSSKKNSPGSRFSVSFTFRYTATVFAVKFSVIREVLFRVRTSPNIIRIIKSVNMSCGGHVASMGEFINVYRILVEKHEGKIPL